ncbi:MAG: iron-sulfur cluster assembly protein [Thermoproteota archaeon]
MITPKVTLGSSTRLPAGWRIYILLGKNTRLGGRSMSKESDVLSEVKKAVSNVVDPEIGLTLGELNLIKDVRREDGSIIVEFVATTPFCPLAEILALMVKDAANTVVKDEKILVYIRKHINEESINERINRD